MQNDCGVSAGAPANNFSIYQWQQKTAAERLHDDAVFLAQNAKTKLFRIKNFNTNFIERGDGGGGGNGGGGTSTLQLSKEVLAENDCEKSPMFFKVSGSVSYCPQLSGCCIFYNRGITSQQMSILYSVQCQQEIFDEAYKLYENTIPNYKNLFQMCFGMNIQHKLQLLGLDKDTILLKVKNETPSRRNKFLYNTALLQLQMMRFDFIISPNLTQYYIKQYLNNVPLCLDPPATTMLLPNNPTVEQSSSINANINQQTTPPPPPPPQTRIINAATLQLPTLDDYEDSDDEEGVGGGGVVVDDENNENDDDDYDEDDDDDDDEYESELSDTLYENNSYKEGGMRKQIPAVVVANVINDETIKPQQKDDRIVVEVPRRKIGRRPMSIVSSGTAASSAAHKRSLPSEISSVEIIPTQSETGVTVKFKRMTCEEYNDAQSTGITDNVGDLSLTDNAPQQPPPRYVFEEIMREDASSTGGGDDDETNILNEKCEETLSFLLSNMTQEASSSIFTERHYKVYNNQGLIVYDPRFLETLQNDDTEYIQEIFDDYSDLHENVRASVNEQNLTRGNMQNINRAIVESRHDEKDRLKQAIYLYLLNPSVKIRYD